MLIVYLLLCILGLILVVVSHKFLKPLSRALEERHQKKEDYQRQLLESVQNLETAVVPEPVDAVQDTLDAIVELRQQQRVREAVEKLIDQIDE